MGDGDGGGFASTVTWVLGVTVAVGIVLFVVGVTADLRGGV
jgi:hypothetical protein